MEDIRIIIVDDEPVILESINDYLDDYVISLFDDPALAVKNLEENFYDIIIVDYKMPGINGLELLSTAKKINAYRYGILLTAYADKELLENFISEDVIKKVIEKPLDLKELDAAIVEAVTACRRMQEEEIRLLAMEEVCSDAFSGLGFLNDRIIGLDGGLKEVFQKVNDIAKSDENVLVTGETGTGKEMIVRAIHGASGRKDGPFIKINCGAIPDTLIESELFGYARGAFSGAVKDKPGKIELAHGGTLFLDEIGELNLELQTRLLQVIQEKSVERLGSNTRKQVNFRLICATNRDLAKAIQENLFREDLYFRINIFPILVPPLRERKEDIHNLIDYLIEKSCRELGYDKKQIDDESLNELIQYPWPGNVRELENVIKRSILQAGRDERMITREYFEYLSYTGEKREKKYSTAIDTILTAMLEKKRDIKSVERDLINAILDHFDGNVMEAVRNSGIPKDRFYRSR